MKYKGIEIGIPSKNQMVECAKHFGLQVQVDKIYKSYSADGWSVLRNKPKETLEEFMRRVARKRKFQTEAYKEKRKKKSKDPSSTVRTSHKVKLAVFNISAEERDRRYRAGMPSYDDQLHMKEWYEFRELVLKQKGYRCEMCGDYKHLQIHHKKYVSGHYAWEYPLTNMIVLCGDCHKALHGIH